MQYKWHEIIVERNIRYVNKSDIINMLRLMSYEEPVFAKYPEVQKQLRAIADTMNNTNLEIPK